MLPSILKLDLISCKIEVCMPKFYSNAFNRYYTGRISESEAEDGQPLHDDGGQDQVHWKTVLDDDVHFVHATMGFSNVTFSAVT